MSKAIKGSLGKFTDLITSGSRDWAQYYSDSGALFLRMTNLPRDGIYLLLSDIKYVNLNGTSSDGIRTKVQPGDILISITAELGKIGYVSQDDLTEAYVNQHVALVRVNHPAINNKYLAYYLSYKDQRKRFESFNDAGAKAGLNLKTIGDFKISLPPLPEQEQIAAILSTWDEAIAKTQALIEMKEQLLSCLINKIFWQEKFQGREKPLSVITDVIVSSVDKITREEDTPVKLCNYTDVYYNHVIHPDITFMESTATGDEIRKFSLQTGDVIITKDSETPKDIGIPAYVSQTIEGLVCGYHLTILRPKPNMLYGQYLAYMLQSQWVKHEFSRFANGATRFGLTTESYDKIKVPLPGTEQQIKIASLLNILDDEKLLLSKRLDYLKTQKQGLMQKLFSGEWSVALVPLPQLQRVAV